jgi:endoglucanase
MKLSTIFGIIFLSMCSLIQAQVQYTGVNLAGADFGTDDLPGTYNTHYTYPTHAEVDYFIGKGMNIFRLPFMWERLQNDQNGPLNTEELARIKDFVNYVTSKQAKVILDPHNGARYYGEIIGIDGDNGALPLAAFEDFWTKLASQFKNNNNVIFGLMNEPHEMPSELWLDDANAAISAIRATGAQNLILVPGNAYTGAHSWNDNWYGTPNGEVMQNIIDPGNNYAFEAHQYLDSDSSGTSPNCVSATIGSTRLQEFTNWLRQHNERGFLGEFAGGRNANCYNALGDMLDFIDANDDVWLGWSYWAAGPWWGEDIFTLEPKADGTDRPQMAILLEHISSAQDADHDGITDAHDNCTLVANADQEDSDGDGYGNYCDADLDNNGLVSFNDLDIFRSYFGTSNPDADFDGSGSVSFGDLDIFRSLFGLPPGPAGRL